MTGVVKERCRVNHIRDLKFKECKKSATILEPSDFCPFPYYKHEMMFNPSYVKLVLTKLEEQNSYATRLWVKDNSDLESWGNADFITPFYKLAEQKCPLIYQFCGEAGRF